MADRRGRPDGQDFRELGDAAPGRDVADFPIGCWRQGSLLVLHRAAPLPNVCLVTNRPTQLLVRKTFGYVPGMVWLTFFLSPFIWLLVRWLMQAKVELRLPLAEEYLARESRLRKMRAVFAFIGGLMFVLGVWQLNDPRLPVGGWEMIVGGLLLGMGVYGWSLFSSTRLRITRYEEPYVWLRGVNSEWLETLPEWPYE